MPRWDKRLTFQHPYSTGYHYYQTTDDPDTLDETLLQRNLLSPRGQYLLERADQQRKRMEKNEDRKILPILSVKVGATGQPIRADASLASRAKGVHCTG